MLYWHISVWMKDINDSGEISLGIPLIWDALIFVAVLKQIGGKNMAAKNGRTDRAQEKALAYLDYIMECFETPDFVEVTGRMGGDVITYRVYDDGTMYER